MAQRKKKKKKIRANASGYICTLIETCACGSSFWFFSLLIYLLDRTVNRQLSTSRSSPLANCIRHGIQCKMRNSANVPSCLAVPYFISHTHSSSIHILNELIQRKTFDWCSLASYLTAYISCAAAFKLRWYILLHFFHSNFIIYQDWLHSNERRVQLNAQLNGIKEMKEREREIIAWSRFLYSFKCDHWVGVACSVNKLIKMDFKHVPRHVKQFNVNGWIVWLFNMFDWIIAMI